jgi:hypothetical protein
VQKVFHPNPRIGFLAAARLHDSKQAELSQRVAAAAASAVGAAEKALRDSRTIAYNSRVDAAVTGAFLVLVALITALSAREWLLLLSRRKPARMSETEPVLLPGGMLGAEPSAIGAMSALALGVSVIKEISGAAAVERTEVAAMIEAGNHRGCQCRQVGARRVRANAYLTTIERRFTGVTRCC